MPARTIKSLKRDANLRRRARHAAEAIRDERGDSLKSSSHVVITRSSTATGKGQVAFRAAKLLKAPRRGHG
jgi:hypothetical protein